LLLLLVKLQNGGEKFCLPVTPLSLQWQLTNIYWVVQIRTSVGAIQWTRLQTLLRFDRIFACTYFFCLFVDHSMTFLPQGQICITATAIGILNCPVITKISPMLLPSVPPPLFCYSGVWTQALTLARQALLLLEPLHQPFYVCDGSATTPLPQIGS
jgi:hypothetical protein